MSKETNLKTRISICDAFQELLEEKALTHISVTEICNRSNISRQTFYRHFDDIYSLVIWSFDYNVAGSKTYDASKDFEHSCVVSFSNMMKRPKIYKHFFLNDENNVFFDRFLRSRIEYAKKIIGEKHLDDNILFSLELYWSGYIYMINKWIASGMKESPENMGKYAYESLPIPLRKYYY